MALTAFREVEDGLSGVRILARQQGVQREAANSASRAVEIALNEYRAGTQNYTTVVTAQAIALNNRVAVLQIALNRFVTAVALVRALGGGWDARRLPANVDVIVARLPVDRGQALRLDE